MLGGGFNQSTQHRWDPINCYIAGLEKTKKAVKIALKVSQDESLHHHIREDSNPFDRSELFQKAAKGYAPLAGRVGCRRTDGSKYDSRDIDHIAKKLYDQGESFWKHGFKEFVKADEGLGEIEPPDVVKKYTLLKELVDFDIEPDRVEQDLQQIVRARADTRERKATKLIIKIPRVGPVHITVGELWDLARARKEERETKNSTRTGLTEGLKRILSPGRRTGNVSVAATSAAGEGNRRLNIQTEGLDVASRPLASIGTVTSDLRGAQHTGFAESDKSGAASGAASGPTRTVDGDLTTPVKLCGQHKKMDGSLKLYPTTKDDYDTDPKRCKALVGDREGERQCSRGRSIQSRMQGLAYEMARAAMPRYICGMHQRVKPGNLEYYTGENYDPGRCSAMYTTGGRKGEQCSSRRKS